MNWLYIIVMAYIVISALRGYHRGFLRVVYSMAALLISIIFIGIMTPLAGGILRQYTPVYDQLEKGCEKLIRTQIEAKLNDDGTLSGNLNIPDGMLPSELQKLLEQGTHTSVAHVLETKEIYRRLAEPVAAYCVNMITFFVSLIVIRIILFVISKNINFVSKIPGIHLLNMILGFFAGAAKAFIVIWTFFLIIKLTAMLPFSAELIKMTESDAVLNGLYEQNRIEELLTYLTGWIKF